jgi:hypothetical protein
MYLHHWHACCLGQAVDRRLVLYLNSCCCCCPLLLLSPPGWEKPWVEQIIDRIMKGSLKTTEERTQGVVSGNTQFCVWVCFENDNARVKPGQQVQVDTQS